MKLNKVIVFSLFSLIFLVGVLGSASALSSITITYPNGGEYLRDSVSTTWTASGTPTGLITVMYSNDSGLHWTALDTLPPGSTGYTWNTVANSKGDGNNYLLYVIESGTSVWDVSNGIFSVDNHAPTSNTIVLSTYQNTLTFNVPWIGNDGTGSGINYVELYYRKDAGSWIKYGTTFSSSPISFNSATTGGDGVYEFYTVATDRAGNVESATGADTSTRVDTVKPSTTDDYTLTGWQTSDKMIILTPTDSAPSSGIQWTKYCIDTANSCNTSAGTTYSTPVTVSTEGTNYFRYASIDNAGNVQDTVSKTVMIDKSAPTVGVTGAPSGFIVNPAGVSALVGCSDINSGCNTSTYKFRFYDTNPGACSTDYATYTDINPVTGHKWVCVAAKDNAGNTGFSSPIEFTIFSTVQSAIDAASSGTAITVNAGTYNENINVNKAVALQGASSSSVIVNALNPANSIFYVTANSVNISGFTINGATGGGQAGIFLGAGIANCNISNNILTNNYDGIWLGSGSNHNILASNTLSGNYQGFEVYISSNNAFTNNNASLNSNYGFKIDSGDHNTFTNNVANLNTQYGIRINGGSNYTLMGNTFNLNVLAGIRLKEGITNLDIQNSIITNNPTGIDIDVSVVDVTTWAVMHNNIVGNTNYISNAALAGILNAENNWFGTTNGSLIATKVSGNVDYTPWAYAQGLYDSTNPTIGTITITPRFGSFISGISAISASLSDSPAGIASCEYTLNGGTTWTAGTINSGNCVLTGINTATANSININATDNSGNVGTGTAVSVTPDITAPITTDSGTDTNWHSTNVVVSLTPSDIGGSDVASTYYCVDQIGTCNPTTAGTSVTVSLEGINYVRYKSVDNVGNNETVKSAAHTVMIDKSLPLVSGVSPRNTNVPVGQLTTVTATVADLGGSGINETRLYYTPVGGIEVSTLMTLIGGVYSATIPAQSARGTVPYHITALDVAGNLRINSTYNLTINNMIWNLTSPSGWNLVSSPKTLTNPNKASLLGSATVWEYNAQTKTWTNPTTLNPGVGYWIDNNGNTQPGLDYAGDCTGPQCLPSGAINIDTLQNGWNLVGLTTTNTTMTVGNAFQSRIYPDEHLSVQDVIAYNETTDMFESLTGSSPMNPGEGYWVYLVK